MNCEILVRPTEKGYSATILGLPDCTTEAATRIEAIEKVKAEAEEMLDQSEIVQAEIPSKIKRKSFAGMWANDKTFDKFLAAMQAYRDELDAEWEQEQLAQAQTQR
jgi:predicted RNase H-like HicB family nuclease